MRLKAATVPDPLGLVRRCNHPGCDIYRKPAVLAPQHLLSLEAFEQAPTYIGAQDAAAKSGLGIGHRFGSYGAGVE